MDQVYMPMVNAIGRSQGWELLHLERLPVSAADNGFYLLRNLLRCDSPTEKKSVNNVTGVDEAVVTVATTDDARYVDDFH
eukprot:scaffold474774_cov18-Prasinocladus_malaysianus.AAC.1